jgi:hypothetical protein
MTGTAAEQGVVLETDATGLAWLAETADGARNSELILVLDKDDQPRLRVEDPKNDEERKNAVRPDDRIVVKVMVKTPTIQKNRTRIQQIILTAAGRQQTVDPAEGYDALFWTESAVEKFLYPYYRSQRLWDKRMEKLMERFNSDPNLMAVMHQAPSHAYAIDARVGSTLHVWCKAPQDTDLALHSLLDYIPKDE